MKLTRQAMEARRLAAARAISKGISVSKIARLFDVSRTTAYRWDAAVKAGASLARSKPPGRPRRLDRAVLMGLLAEQEHWTGRELVHRIEERLGIRYNLDHAARIGSQLAPERFGRLKVAV